MLRLKVKWMHADSEVRYDLEAMLQWITKKAFLFVKWKVKTTAGLLFSRLAVDFRPGSRKYFCGMFYISLRKVMEDYARRWKIMQHSAASCELMGEIMWDNRLSSAILDILTCTYIDYVMDRNLPTRHIATFSCVQQFVAQVWKWSSLSWQHPTFRNTSRHGGQTHNVFCPTMLRYVELTCCVWPGL